MNSLFFIARPVYLAGVLSVHRTGELPMDPNQTFRDMLEAIRSQDFETARELAIVLRRWICNGGFYPDQAPPEEIDARIKAVLQRKPFD